jgi:hypothetical protein
MMSFKAAMRWHVNKRYVKQVDIARAAGVNQVQISKILNKVDNWGKEDTRLRIVNFLTPEKTYEEFINFGQSLLAKESPAEYVMHPPKKTADIMSQYLTPEQAKSLQDYRELLLAGGEGVEVIKAAVSALAEKKLSK